MVSDTLWASTLILSLGYILFGLKKGVESGNKLEGIFFKGYIYNYKYCSVLSGRSIGLVFGRFIGLVWGGTDEARKAPFKLGYNKFSCTMYISELNNNHLVRARGRNPAVCNKRCAWCY